MTTHYRCGDCKYERMWSVEDNELRADKIGTRVTCPGCQGSYELDGDVAVRTLISYEPLYPGQVFEYETPDVTLPCCQRQTQVKTKKYATPRMGFVDCAPCGSSWFARESSYKNWVFTDARTPPLRGEAVQRPCPGCGQSLSFSDRLVYHANTFDDWFTFCPHCRAFLTARKDLRFRKIEVQYQDVEIPFGCPDVRCESKKQPIVVRLPVGGGAGIFTCSSCATKWSITDSGRSWIDLPVKPYRTERAITDCQTCGAKKSFYASLFANNEMTMSCRACGKVQSMGSRR